MNSFTPYGELNEVLRELVRGMQDALADDFIGAYLQGSFAVGDFDEHSDVDFIVAMEDDLSAEQLDLLQELHPRIYNMGSEWAKHLEGSYFPREILRDYDKSGTPVWYLEHGAQTLQRSTHCNTVVVKWTVRNYGVAMAGPAARTLIDPIPTRELRRDIKETIISWGEEILTEPERFSNRFYQSFIVLSYCRMLRDLYAGDTGSKRVGAEWAKANLDPRWSGLIDRAWDGRPDPARSVREPADPAEFAETLEFMKQVMELTRGYVIPDQASLRGADWASNLPIDN
ncbi:MAG: DUF4111 domain-containing protein [Candidatus Coatesbacteria bacterium]|nr:DUF4111 domain-containing protein [Candidatus Coatesbacteria bacterium]